MIENYHTHHNFCGHAEGNAWDYVEEAIKLGFSVLGISDHAPNKLINDWGVRMKESQLDEYLADIESARKKAGKKITVLSGLEVEYFPNNEEYYERLKKKTDYLIHGQHYITEDFSYNNLKSGFGLKTKGDIFKYSEFLVQAIESGHFLMFAHPDLYMTGYREWDKNAEEVAHIICRAAKKENAILEFNSNGFRRGLQKTKDGLKRNYPREEFWKIVKSYGVRTFINSDCHTPEFLYDHVIREAEEVYKELGLKNTTVTKTK